MIDTSTMIRLDFFQLHSNKTVNLFASENVFKCDSETASFVTWIQITTITVGQEERLVCETEERKEYIEDYSLTSFEQSCKNHTIGPAFSNSSPNSKIQISYILGGISSVIIIFIFIIVIFCFLKRSRIRKLAKSKGVSLKELIDSKERTIAEQIVAYNRHSAVHDNIFYIGLNESLFTTEDRESQFAAFLAYSHEDRDFVINKLYNPLQKQLRESFPDWNEELLTVLYDKSFLPGQCTMDVCRAAVCSGYVTVAIVSDAFARSTWCHYELETAIETRVPSVSFRC